MTERRPSVGEMVRYFGWLGMAGFGGPIALVARMERDLVAERQWLDASEFKDGLAFSQLAPGPLAAQLAIYLGWFWRGVWGATACGIAFITPSLLMVIAVAELYLRFGGLSWLEGAWYGVGAVIIAIIARSAWRLARRTLGKDQLLWALFALTAVVTAWREAEMVLLFVACGVAAVVARRREASHVAVPGFLAMSLAGTTMIPSVGALFLYFGSAGLFVFGSGLAIVPLLHGGVVQEHHWLTERQFLDAVAVALITPGPVVIAVAFMGYLIAGLGGALAAAAGVFAPVYLITVALAPRFQRLKANPSVHSFIDGVTAAAIGAIAGSVFVLGRRAIVDWQTSLLAVSALAALLLVRRLPEPLVIALAAAIGIFAKGHTMEKPRTVVFVCEHGTAKSVVALEYFNREALTRGLSATAISRGTHPESAMPAGVRDGLSGDGFDVSSFQSRAFTPADLESAQLVVAFDAKVEPIVGQRVPILRWDEMPAVSGGYSIARTAIAARVSRLVDSLVRDRAKSGR